MVAAGWWCKQFFRQAESFALPGRRMRLYMKHRQSDTAPMAAAKESFSTWTSYRIEQDPRLPSQKKGDRGSRPEPLAGACEAEVVC